MRRGENMQAKGILRKQVILDLLKTGPKTRKQIVDALGAGSSSISAHLVQLHEAPKRIYVCGHEPNHQGMPAKVWALGDKPDVEYVPNERPAAKTSAEERRQQVLTLLREQPRSAQQLVGAIHVVKKTISIYIAQLRDPENRKLFIVKWLPAGEAYPDKRASAWVPVYAVGSKPDAPMPAPETKAARYARMKLSKEFCEGERRRAKIYYTVKKARKKPQGIFAALGI